MVRSMLLFSLLSCGIFAQDAFERNCITCHQTLPATLQEMFKHYLLIYSSEMNVKAGIRHYLRYPSKDISVMSDLFIDNYGIKKKSTLTDEELKKVVDIYWDKFKVFDKLK